jgi:hypothetical protein
MPEWRCRLVAAAGSADPRGLVSPGCRLLFVATREAAAVADVIEAIAAVPALTVQLGC